MSIATDRPDIVGQAPSGAARSGRAPLAVHAAPMELGPAGEGARVTIDLPLLTELSESPPRCSAGDACKVQGEWPIRGSRRCGGLRPRL
jgi:hypothetical protein